jgi:citrate synthase
LPGRTSTRVHQPYVYPDNDLDYASNFLKMMFSVPAEEYLADPVVANALNMLLILHADHGQNCSSSAVSLVGSGHANIFSSVSAGIHALSGPLHGGANQAVLEMLE